MTATTRLWTYVALVAGLSLTASAGEHRVSCHRTRPGYRAGIPRANYQHRVRSRSETLRSTRELLVQRSTSDIEELPSVKYRNGVPWHEKVSHGLHGDRIRAGVGQASNRCKQFAQHTKTNVAGAALMVGDVAKMATLPARHVLEAVPLSKVLFSSDAHDQLAERVAQHHRAKQARQFQEAARRDQATYRTNR